MEAITALEDEILIHLPQPRVWSLLTDWTAAPEWMPGVDTMHAHGAAAPGQVLRYTAGDHERQLSVVTYEPGGALTLATGSDGADVRIEYGYLLVAEGDQTRLRLRVGVRVNGDGGNGVGELREALADAESGQLESFRAYAEKAP
ncbi:SRPBCC family protein [Zhihengliuella halotolerans]|uniref:Polyketide cyclase/dehydrase/lipid transport protein n=1 Tax=Zhihengliuella halotolerans TaxID=370736 RepID=A0A4Q8AIC7_9MICC|nr:SRPBCC family protein [Zhihengliuella halotolerans]RZU63489.1 polyketide cyclase/dehydrase/lipid transport protein [Zhihengliuella halotolerans]